MTNIFRDFFHNLIPNMFVGAQKTSGKDRFDIYSVMRYARKGVSRSLAAQDRPDYECHQQVTAQILYDMKFVLSLSLHQNVDVIRSARGWLLPGIDVRMTNGLNMVSKLLQIYFNLRELVLQTVWTFSFMTWKKVARSTFHLNVLECGHIYSFRPLSWKQTFLKNTARDIPIEVL